MAKQAIKFKGVIGKPRVLSDDSLKISVTTATEMTDEEILAFIKLRDVHADIFFKPHEKAQDDVVVVERI